MPYPDLPLALGQFPIKHFISVPASDLTDALNTLINEMNVMFIQLGIQATGSVYIVRAQVLQNLAAVDPTGLVKYNLPADPYDPVRIGWDGPFYLPGGALANFIQAQLGYSAGQMATFNANCLTFPVST